MACNCSTYRSNIASARNDKRIWAAEIEGFREKIRDARSIKSDFQDHQSSVDDHKSKLDQMADAEHGRFSGNNHKIRYVTKVKAVATSLSSVKSAISSNISNLEDKITEYEEAITSRENKIAANESWIAGMEASIASCMECY